MLALKHRWRFGDTVKPVVEWKNAMRLKIVSLRGGMNEIILLILVLALFLPPCSALAADASECSRSTFKFESLPDGHIRIPVAIEGRKLAFLLDTGGVSTTIKWQYAKEMGLRVRQSTVQLTGVGGTPLTIYATAENFSVGDVHVKNWPIFIETRDLPDADGTLAADILRDYDVEIDFAGSDLSLISPDYCTVTSTAVIAMDVDPNGHVRFPVKIDGQTIIATLDTGSATSLISMKAADLLGIGPNSPGLALMRDTGQYQIYAYPFHSLDFRGVLVKNPHIAIVSDGFIPGSESDLVLGMDVLRQLHFIIAYRDSRLFISPTATN